MKIHGTAKGGALSTKDFGVAFGGAPAVPVTIIEQTTDNDLIVSLSDGHPFAGYRIASGSNVIGYTLTSLTWRLYRVGSPPAGNIEARVFTDGASGSPGSYTQIGASIDQTTVSTSSTNYTFDGSGEVTLKEADYITVASTNGGTSASHMVKVRGGTGCDNFITGTNLESSQYNTIPNTWANADNICLTNGQPVCIAIGHN